MLDESFKARMPFSQVLWTQFAITFKTTLFLLSFDTLKLHSQFSRKRSIRFFYNFAIVETTMSSPRSRRRISEIIPGGVCRHFVAMVTRILAKCTPFETFIFLQHTTNVLFFVGLIMMVLQSLKVERYRYSKIRSSHLNNFVFFRS